jgi:hypothetical protein
LLYIIWFISLIINMISSKTKLWLKFLVSHLSPLMFIVLYNLLVIIVTQDLIIDKKMIHNKNYFIIIKLLCSNLLFIILNYLVIL